MTCFYHQPKRRTALLTRAVAVLTVATLPLTASANTAANASANKLRADLYKSTEQSSSKLAALCQSQPPVRNAIVTEAVIGLVGKAVGGLLDGIAARMRAEAATLEARSSIDAFYKGKAPLMDGACLVIHNGTHPNGDDASIVGVFQAEFSKDRTAWRFQTKRWTFDKFIIGSTRRFGQVESERDFAFKVQLSRPGQESGEGSAFMEHILSGTTLQGIKQAFVEGERLPWMPVPVGASSDDDAVESHPMNLHVTLVETTKPGQLAVWLRETVTERKDDIVALAKNATRLSLDPSYAAAQSVNATTAASAAYGEYKSAWDSWSTAYFENEPKAPADAGTNPQAQKTHVAAMTAWRGTVAAARALAKAKGIAAAGAFSAAGLAWPGDLPDVPTPKP